MKFVVTYYPNQSEGVRHNINNLLIKCIDIEIPGSYAVHTCHNFYQCCFLHY